MRWNIGLPALTPLLHVASEYFFWGANAADGQVAPAAAFDRYPPRQNDHPLFHQSLFPGMEEVKGKIVNYVEFFTSTREAQH